MEVMSMRNGRKTISYPGRIVGSKFRLYSCLDKYNESIINSTLQKANTKDTFPKICKQIHYSTSLVFTFKQLP